MNRLTESVTLAKIVQNLFNIFFVSNFQRILIHNPRNSFSFRDIYIFLKFYFTDLVLMFTLLFPQFA